MSRNASPDERLMAILAKAGIATEGGASAWRASPAPSPLLGRVLAAFGSAASNRALDVAAELVRRVGDVVGDDEGDVARALMAARELEIGRGGGGPRGRVASELGDLQNEHVLACRPALAALADAARHVAEVWADPASDDAEVDPFARGRSVATALIDALLLHQGVDESDRSRRSATAAMLLEWLRAACPEPP